MATDTDLLRSYARDRSESAFTELVQRHINLVHSAALREAHGDASMAEDITQAVFAELARKASSLLRHPALAGWVYTCVRRMTAKQNDRWAELTAENERLSNLVVLARPPLSDEQFRELLRLRGEVAMLRQQTNAVPQLRKENRRLAARLATAQNQQVHTTQAELDEQLSAETFEAMRNICLGLRTALQSICERSHQSSSR